MACRMCSSDHLVQRPRKFANGTEHIEEVCTDCGAHQRFVSQDKPATDFVMPFGKYGGRTIGEIMAADPDYVEWAAENLKQPKIRKKFIEAKKG